MAGLEFGFAADPARRLQLLNGWDDIDLTDQYRNAISTYRAARRISAAWTFPPEARAST
jgi:3-isopropylmalate/(R)-2-methylmalate dehydratase small subunit